MLAYDQAIVLESLQDRAKRCAADAEFRRKFPLIEAASRLVVEVRINGQKCWLWRAVDQDGYVLDEAVQTRLTPRLPSAC